jgi:hypothetical protein
MGHGAALAGLERQAGLGAVEGLDLGLLVEREDQAVRRRIEVEPDDRLELGGEVGIGRALEPAQAMRLQVVGGPDPLHRAQGDPGRFGHGPAGPVGRLARRLGAGQRHHPAHDGVVQARLARLAGRVAQQPVDPGQGKAPLPAPHRRTADARAPRHLGDAQPVGRMEKDPRPQQVLVGAVAIGDDRLKPSTILTGDDWTDILGHPPRLPDPPPLVNPINVSVHAPGSAALHRSTRPRNLCDGCFSNASWRKRIREPLQKPCSPFAACPYPRPGHNARNQIDVHARLHLLVYWRTRCGSVGGALDRIPP